LMQHFWPVVALRFSTGLVVGVGGVLAWWLIGLGLSLTGIGLRARLSINVVRVALGPLVGAVVGALVFCLP